MSGDSRRAGRGILSPSLKAFNCNKSTRTGAYIKAIHLIGSNLLMMQVSILFLQTRRITSKKLIGIISIARKNTLSGLLNG
jgi:hypothetical protein